MLFSATLDRAVDTLVRQYLTEPAIHEADSGRSHAGTMSHHVLQVEREHRLSALVELTSTPGRAVVFARTKHGAKALARQLNRAGVAAVELHGNLSQNARTRNLNDFHIGRASALVATDIAARGIHVDDVALVIHADPPADYKAYLHRSGRTARAGASGTVITLASSAQLGDVRHLTDAARVTPTTTQVTAANRVDLAALVAGTAAGVPGTRAVTAALDPTVKSSRTTRGSAPARRPRPARAARHRGSRPSGIRP
jgi:superfamily II DNA/RNA helicase